MDEPIITARGLGCQAGDRYLIRNIQLSIDEKSRWIVLGTNGCGKTTLLSILAGYQEYTHGELHYRGKNYREENIMEIRKKMGLVSNSYFDRIYQNESVLDILLAGISGTLGIEDGVTDQAIRKIKRMLELIGLAEKQDVPYNWLSKGQRQNILILRALMSNPEVMVLDEPMTGLDVISKQKMMRFVQNMARAQQKTMLYVTHHFEEITPELFDKCLLMRNGQIYSSGAVEEIMRSEVISEFLKQPVTISQNSTGYYQLEFQR